MSVFEQDIKQGGTRWWQARRNFLNDKTNISRMQPFKCGENERKCGFNSENKLAPTPAGTTKRPLLISSRVCLCLSCRSDKANQTLIRMISWNVQQYSEYYVKILVMVMKAESCLLLRLYVFTCRSNVSISAASIALSEHNRHQMHPVRSCHPAEASLTSVAESLNRTSAWLTERVVTVSVAVRESHMICPSGNPINHFGTGLGPCRGLCLVSVHRVHKLRSTVIIRYLTHWHDTCSDHTSKKKT